jgi:small-conductance mechanosensitive channel
MGHSRCAVGIGYNSDFNKTRKILVEIAQTHPKVPTEEEMK